LVERGTPAQSATLYFDDPDLERTRHQSLHLCLCEVMTGTTWPLPVKLRGPTEAHGGAEGAQSLRDRGAKPQARHEPLQRWLDCTSASRDLARRLAIIVAGNEAANTSSAMKKGSQSVVSRAPDRDRRDGIPIPSTTIADGRRAPYETHPNQAARVRSKKPPYVAARSERVNPLSWRKAKGAWFSASCASRSPNSMMPRAPPAPSTRAIRPIRSEAPFTGAI
jgi:hypothetical protein